MGFRTVIIKNRAKLEVRLGSLVVRGDVERKVFLDEINTIIVQSTAVSLTASLLCELTKRNIKVIFCDEKHNPQSELLPYCGAHNTSKRYKQQFNWDCQTKAKIWREIVKQKIQSQSQHLQELEFVDQANLLQSYVLDVRDNDVTNREGHSAKVYFNCLFGGDGSRKSGGFFNTCLNYGYAVLLSAFNREIVASGYLTQIGIWHNNEFNQFNLACDLMEPFRAVVDKTAMQLVDGDKDYKRKMANVLNYKAIVEGKHTTLDLAIRHFAKSVFHALEQQDESLLVFPEKIWNDEL